jgi:serpin B
MAQVPGRRRVFPEKTPQPITGMNHASDRTMRSSTLLNPSVSLLALTLVACSGSSPTPADQPASTAIVKAEVQRDPVSSISPDAITGAVVANNAFAVDLFAQARADQPSGNFLTSPISASLALTMTYAGAAGQTATEMATALHFANAGSSIFDGQNALSQGFAARAATALASDQDLANRGHQPAPSADDYILQVVNSVWGEQTYTWEPPFLNTLAKSYGTGVYVTDFIHQFEQARQTINTWVSDQTADKINNLLPEGSLDDQTRMVLVNAIHLKFPWATAFKASATAPATFTKTDGSTLSASFMNDMQTLPYVDDGKAQVVELPLSGGQVSVLIALPHGDLATYEAGLSVESAALKRPLASAWVTLSLPKLSFTSPTFSLKSALTAMGMKQAFDPDAANFSAMCAHPPNGENLYVADVLQKAMVAMQETGVEAAAATAVVIAGETSVGPQPPQVSMVVNRPYLVAIVDNPTGAVLFLGHIEDPTDAGGK